MKNITMAQIITWGITIGLTIFGTYTAASRTSAENIESLRQKDTEVSERVAKVEEAISTIKATNVEIRSDIKEILRRTR